MIPRTFLFIFPSSNLWGIYKLYLFYMWGNWGKGSPIIFLRPHSLWTQEMGLKCWLYGSSAMVLNHLITLPSSSAIWMTFVALLFSHLHPNTNILATSNYSKFLKHIIIFHTSVPFHMLFFSWTTLTTHYWTFFVNSCSSFFFPAVFLFLFAKVKIYFCNSWFALQWGLIAYKIYSAFSAQ